MKKPGMTNRKKQSTRGIVVFLGAALFCTSGVTVSAKGDSLEDVIQKTADYETGIVTDPTVASIGGEWTVIPLARGRHHCQMIILKNTGQMWRST